MTTLELFRALILAMPVSLVPDATVDQFLLTASCRLCADAYGTKFEEASVWLAAHMLAVSGVFQNSAGTVPGAGGPISSLKTGDESIGFSSLTSTAGSSGIDADLMSTAYGRQFIFLRDTRPARAPTVITIC